MITDPQSGWASRDRARRVFLALGVLASAFLSGCGSKPGGELYPVRGQVLYKTRPATGATVAFHPQGGTAGQPVPQATVGEDGSFQLSTRTRHDGAAAGRYTVTVVWPSDRAKEEDGTPAGPDRLGNRFANPKTTPLRADVERQDNRLEPFVLR